MKSNPVGWFEIPVSDIDRAIKFYNAVFGFELKSQDMGAIKMAWFPYDHSVNGATGSLVYNEEFYSPSPDKGALIYFSCEEVSSLLSKVILSGGTVLLEKKKISEDHGYMGVFIDSEGNRIAVHSNQ